MDIWQPEEVIGKKLSDWQFILPEDVEVVNDVVKRLSNGSETQVVSRNCNYAKDGSIVHCEWYNSALCDESGIRLVRRADGYYCQFCIDVEVKDIQPLTGNEIGLDVGIESFYTDSNRYQEANPKFLRKVEKSVKHAQRRIYKKKKGSSGRKKARAIFARKHLNISRQRNEHAKKVARNVCKSNDLVAYENLQVRNLLRNHCLAKSIADASWYLFRQWIEYFAGKFGKLAVAVAPHYTSQKCSSCGVIVKKSLSTRTHVCSCGCNLHRDENAAINILNLARKARDGQSRSNAVGLLTSTLLGESLLEQVTR
jgi:putative transposase